MYFQNKFFANWEPEEGSDEDADETSSEEEEEDEEEDASDDEEDDECSDEADQMQSSKPSNQGSKATPADSNFRQAHVEAFVPPKKATSGYSVPNDFEDDSEEEQDSDEYGSEDSDHNSNNAGKHPNGKKQRAPINQNESLASASSLVRNQLKRPLVKDKDKQARQSRGGGPVGAGPGINDLSVDVSLQETSQLTTGRDVMASFGGFLEKRKKDKQMARNSMMSEIDGLVTNLHTDINKMMETSKRIKD